MAVLAYLLLIGRLAVLSKAQSPAAGGANPNLAAAAPGAFGIGSIGSITGNAATANDANAGSSTAASPPSPTHDDDVYFSQSPLDIIDSYPPSKCSLRAARWAEDQLSRKINADPSNFVHFVHVPRTAGRTLFFCAVKPRFPTSEQCPKAYDHLRLNEMVKGCKAMASHDDFSVSKFLPPDASFITTVRRPVDRILSSYEFATEIGFRAYNMDDAEIARKKATFPQNKTQTTEVWPWSHLVPIIRKEYNHRKVTRKDDLEKLRTASKSMSAAEASALANAYDFPGYLSLRDFVEDPLVADLIHEGTTLQLLGLTNYSTDVLAPELRHCVVQQRDVGAREVLLFVALKRLRNFMHVGIFDRLDESIELLYARAGWDLANDRSVKGEKSIMGAMMDESKGGSKRHLESIDDGEEDDGQENGLAEKTQHRRLLSESMSPLPEPWVRYESERYIGRVFYHNPATNESTWEHPEKELMQQDSSEPANEEEKAKLAAAQAPGETAPTPTQDAAASAEAERADKRAVLERKLKEARKFVRRAEFKRYASLEERRADMAKLNDAVAQAEAELTTFDEVAVTEKAETEAAEAAASAAVSSQEAPARKLRYFGRGDMMKTFFRTCSWKSGTRAKSKRVKLHYGFKEVFGIPLQFSKVNRAALPVSVIDRIAERNQLDTRLYEFASRIFEARLAEVRNTAAYKHLDPNPTERQVQPVLGSAERGSRALLGARVSEPSTPPLDIHAGAKAAAPKAAATATSKATAAKPDAASAAAPSAGGATPLASPPPPKELPTLAAAQAQRGAMPGHPGIPGVPGGAPNARGVRRKTIMGNRAPQGPALLSAPVDVDIFAEADDIAV